MRSDDWHVDYLLVQNFRLLTDFHIKFGPEVTLLVGTNGSGKTTVLDALAVMLSTLVSELGGESRAFAHSDVRKVPSDLFSEERLATSEAQYPMGADIEAVLSDMTFRWGRHLGSARGRTTRGDLGVRDYVRQIRQRATARRNSESVETVLPVFAYYGVERLTGTRRADGRIPSSRTGAYASALDPRSDLTRLASFLESLDGQILAAQAYGDATPTAALDQFRAIDMACASILETVGWKNLRWNRGIGALTLSHPEQGTLPLTSLASGTKIAAGLAIDLASRIARANPHLGSEELLRETPGVVLIDEVDLHLHPTWQQRIVPALRRTFPRVQFVISTHSPQVIATVESENIRILKGDNVVVPRFAHGLKPEVVLAEVQNTDPTPRVPARDNLDQYLKAVYANEGNTPESLSLRDKIDATLGGADLNPELVEADAYLMFSSLED